MRSTNSHNGRRNRGKNNNKRNKKDNLGLSERNHSMVRYALPPTLSVVPDCLVTNLKFLDTSNTLLNNVGATFATRRYRPTSVFDMDPALGGTTTIGFTELSALYSFYRVISSRIRVDFSNIEGFPLQAYIWPSNNDLGANYNVPDAALTNPYSRRGILSKIGGMDRVTLTEYLHTKEYVGAASTLNLDSFRSAVSTSPTNNWFWNVGIWSGSATVLVSGVLCLTLIDVKVEFSERKILTS